MRPIVTRIKLSPGRPDASILFNKIYIVRHQQNVQLLSFSSVQYFSIHEHCTLVNNTLCTIENYQVATDRNSRNALHDKENRPKISALHACINSHDIANNLILSFVRSLLVSYFHEVDRLNRLVSQIRMHKRESLIQTHIRNQQVLLLFLEWMHSLAFVTHAEHDSNKA